MKRIFTFYDPSANAPRFQAELIRLWDRSWSARGFDTRLLTLRHAQEHRFFKPEYATGQWWDFALEVKTHHTCNAWFVPPTVINYTLTIHKLLADERRENWNWKSGCFRPSLDKMYGRRYEEASAWRTSDLVIFPKHFSMDDILKCGRQLL